MHVSSYFVPGYTSTISTEKPSVLSRNEMSTVWGWGVSKTSKIKDLFDCSPVTFIFLILEFCSYKYGFSKEIYPFMIRM